MEVLITGGAGFIGSTTASACADSGIVPIVLDDLSTGRREFVGDREFYCGDIADRALLRRIFAEHPDLHAVVHCAAFIVLPDSVHQPLRYYRNNVAKTIEFLDAVSEFGPQRFIFSSSASFYVAGDDFSVDEESDIRPNNPYSQGKWFVELMLRDIAAAGMLRALSLRYFNPIGADPKLRSGLQQPHPTHALGTLIDAYESNRPFVVTGTSWPTRDGTGIRDYVDVWDLAQAHVAALNRFDNIVDGHLAVNLGAGRGTTVRELLSAFEEVTGAPMHIVESEPRPADTVGCFTRSERAARLLGWRARTPLTGSVEQALRWVKRRREMLGA